MRIKELTWRHRNDFHFIAECACGHESRHGDGYADAFYQKVVFPSRACPKCGLNELGMTQEEFIAAKERGDIEIVYS